MAIPSAVKLSHAIHDHMEQHCNENIPLHFHEAEFDCDFQKFKLSTQFYTGFQEFDIYKTLPAKETHYDLYTFISKCQKFHFSLRGPPAIS